MKLKVESWHICVALIIAVISAVIGAVIQILLVSYGVFDHVGVHQSTALNGTWSEFHDFTFVDDSVCAPDSPYGSTAALTQKCAMNGYVAYETAECSAFSGRPGQDLFVRCVR